MKGCFPFKAFPLIFNSCHSKFRVNLVHVCTLPELYLNHVVLMIACIGEFHRPVSFVNSKNVKCWPDCMQILDKQREKSILLHQ